MILDFRLLEFIALWRTRIASQLADKTAFINAMPLTQCIQVHWNLDTLFYKMLYQAFIHIYPSKRAYRDAQRLYDDFVENFFVRYWWSCNYCSNRWRSIYNSVHCIILRQWMTVAESKFINTTLSTFDLVPNKFLQFQKLQYNCRLIIPLTILCHLQVQRK